MDNYEEMVDIGILDFLGKWFKHLKSHVFKVEVTNKESTEKLEKAIDNVVTVIKELDSTTKKVEVQNGKEADFSPLLNSMQEVTKAVRELQFPDAVESVTVKNLADIKFPKFPDFPEFPKFPEIKIPEVKFPKTQEVKGDVAVTNLKPLLDGLQVVVDSLNDLKLEMAQSNKEVSTVLAHTRGGKVDVSGLATETTLEEISNIDFATEAKQDTGNSSLSSIDTKLSSQATATKQDTGNTSLSSIDTKLSSQATAANQTTGNASLANIETYTNNIPSLTSGFFGQAVIAVTGTAVQLGSNTLENGVIITAKSSNTGNIKVGGSGVTNTETGAGNGYILEPGASISVAASNTNVLYVNGTAGDIVSFLGS